jgi:hypothetical protein
MKAYTDVNQSRKLAEFLPIESADMAWCNNSIRGVNYTDEFSANLYTVKEMQECFDKALNGWDKYWKLIPCWSLSALLALMPCARIDTSSDGHCRVFWHEMYSDWHESAVDACVELIERVRKEEEQ